MELKQNVAPAHLAVSTRDTDSIFEKIQGLLPKDDTQRSLKAEALSTLREIRQTRWLMYEQRVTSISIPMLIILVLWLTVLFISFGLYAPANGTVVTSLLVSALSVSCAIFLILELYTPYHGLIKISSATLRAALAQLGN
jgi:membrane-bound ClpP family serine protease